MIQRAYAEVNLSKLRENIQDIRSHLSPATKFMAVVKADGYGHGAVEVSQAALLEGVDYLGVAWIGEAQQLRSAGIKAPVLLLSEPDKINIPELIKLNITQTVYTEDFVKVLAKAATAAGKQVKVHVKVDTGMGRIGVQPETALELIRKIIQLPSLELEGIFTHFACADDAGDPYTWVQFSRFKKVLKSLEEENIVVPIKHPANSAATLNFPETQLGMVRIGLAMYKDVLTFKSRVAFVKDVP
ncbi:MAG: alanine racemase, partial [Candidatus Margulisiibacteriota bacterium]